MAKKKKQDIKIDYESTATPKAMAGDIAVFCAHDEIVEITRLIGNPLNPNKHPKAQVKLLAEIIKAQGWRAPITVSKRSGYIVKGHGRLAAAIEGGMSYAPVDYQDYATEAEEYADLIADNRLAELSEIDNVMLTDLLTELDTGEIPIELTGYTDEDIANLISAINGDDDSEDDKIDDIPEEPPKKLQISKPGDLWYVGQHRIICGDSTDKAVIDRLMQGEKGQVVNTDPPYGVSYESVDAKGNKKWDKIANDDLTQDDLMVKLLIPVFKNYMAHTTDDAAFYIWHASATKMDFLDAMTKVGIQEKQYLIWVKNSIVLGHADYQWAHEPCYYCEKAGQTAKWCGDRKQSTAWKVTLRGADGLATVLTGGLVVTDGEGNKVFVSEKPPKGKKIRYVRLSDGRSVTLYQENRQSTVWEVARETDTMHPTQKPVELAVRAITNSSEPGEIVLDFFGGSHSTMIAAEMCARKARICELEPKYVDVGLLRFIKLRGLSAPIICERDGVKYDFLEICGQVAEENGVTVEELINGAYQKADDDE